MGSSKAIYETCTEYLRSGFQEARKTIKNMTEASHRSTGTVPLNRFMDPTADGALSTCTETNHDEEPLSTTDAGSTAAQCWRSVGTPKPLLFSIRPAQRSCASTAALREVFDVGLATVARVHRRAARAVAIIATRRRVVDCFKDCCLGCPLHDDRDAEEDVEARVGRTLAVAEDVTGSLKKRPSCAEGVGVVLALALAPPNSSLLVAERVRRWPLLLLPRGESPVCWIWIIVVVIDLFLLSCLASCSRPESRKGADSIEPTRG